MAWEPDWTVPPGETLAEMMAERKVSAEELAERTSMALAYVEGYLKGVRPMNWRFAVALSETFEGPVPGFWMSAELNYRYDLHRLLRTHILRVLSGERDATSVSDDEIVAQVAALAAKTRPTEEPQ